MFPSDFASQNSNLAAQNRLEHSLINYREQGVKIGSVHLLFATSDSRSLARFIFINKTDTCKSVEGRLGRPFVRDYREHRRRRRQTCHSVKKKSNAGAGKTGISLNIIDSSEAVSDNRAIICFSGKLPCFHFTLCRVARRQKGSNQKETTLQSIRFQILHLRSRKGKVSSN